MNNHERLTLERDAAIRIRNARAAIIQSRPFYAVLISQTEPKASWKFPTMATDSVTHYFNPAFICEITPAETEGTCVHESEHDARHHSTRRNGRDHEDWNRACDYAINGDIIAQGFVLPKGFLYRKDLVGLSAEEIYRILQAEKKPQQPEDEGESDESESKGNHGDSGTGDSEDEDTDEKSEDHGEDDQGSEDDAGGDAGDDADGDNEADGKGTGGDEGDDDADGEGSGEGDGDDEAGTEGAGSGEGNGEDAESNRAPYSCGEVLDAPGSEAEKADTDAKWEVVTRQAVGIAKKRGELPGHWASIIEQRKTPTQDWRAILREYIDAGARRIETWNRPNRRFVHSGLILPGSQRDGINKVCWIIDASGSMVGQHVKVANELQAALDDGAISEAVLIYIDTEVYRVDRFIDGDKIEFGEIRGGGTAMLPAFRWIEENEPDANLIVCLTDLYIEPITADSDPGVPVLWCAYGPDPRVIKTLGDSLAWGKVVDIDNDNE